MLVSCALAQTPEKSLGEIARAARSSRTPTPPGTKVYDNDSLPKNSAVSVVGRARPPEADRKSPEEEREASPRNEESRAEWLAMIAQQELRIAELQDQFNRLERDNRPLKAEYEDPFTGVPKPQPCSTTYNWVMRDGVPVAAECAVLETDRLLQYRRYVEEREAKKAELADAQDTLKQMNEEARRRHINLAR